MTKMTMDIPDDLKVPQIQEKAAFRLERVVHAVARHFHVDFEGDVSKQADPATSKERYVVSFKFSGENAAQANDAFSAFLAQDKNIGVALIRPTQAERLSGDQQPIKMDLGKLAGLDVHNFDAAEHEAGRQALAAARFVSTEEGRIGIS